MGTDHYGADPLLAKILPSFGPAHNNWRTIGGIGRQTGLPHHEVASYINEHPDLFIQSSITPGGTNLIKPNPSMFAVKDL